MQIELISVGKPRDGAAVELHDRYAGRLQRLGVRYRSSWVPEERPGGRFSDEHVRQRETTLLLERTEKGTLIALDRGGESLDSVALAKRLERWAAPRLTLIVGGPLGLHPGLLEKACGRWSLSPLTFPHEIVRSLVAEQLYRAMTIVRGVPYHK